MLFGLLALGKLALTVYDWHTDRREEKEARRDERQARVRAAAKKAERKSKRRYGLGADTATHATRTARAFRLMEEMADETERRSMKGKCDAALESYRETARQVGIAQAESLDIRAIRQSDNVDIVEEGADKTLRRAGDAVRGCYAKWR